MKLLVPMLLAWLPAPQGPDEVLATYQLDGKPASVTRTDTALEMAFRLRRRERGQEAVQQLVDATITRTRAVEKKVMPKEEDVRAFWRELQDQFRAAGKRPEDFAAVRNMSEAELFDYLAVQIAQERVVRAELGLAAKEKVGGDMLRLWLQEERKKTAVVSDADLLPAGTAVRVGTVEVPLIELGLLLLRTAEDDERERFVRELAYMTTLEVLGKREGIEVTARDLDASIQKRRDEAARDPRWRGASFEELLKAQGMTVAALRDLRTFRAQVLLEKLARLRHPDAELAAELAKDRQAVLDRVGARRRISIVFARALVQPNALVPRDFAAARKHLEAVRERVQKEPFENVARIESDHAKSKVQGGDTGWHFRRSDQLPEPVLAAAFTAATGDLPVVQADDGCYLVKVAEVEPDPSDDVLLPRLRERKASELQQKLIADAKIEVAGAGASAGAGAKK